MASRIAKSNRDSRLEIQVISDFTEITSLLIISKSQLLFGSKNDIILYELTTSKELKSFKDHTNTVDC